MSHFTSNMHFINKYQVNYLGGDCSGIVFSKGASGYDRKRIKLGKCKPSFFTDSCDIIGSVISST